jgi:hypothetical protein
MREQPGEVAPEVQEVPAVALEVLQVLEVLEAQAPVPAAVPGMPRHRPTY